MQFDKDADPSAVSGNLLRCSISRLHWHMNSTCVLHTLYVWQVLLVLVHFAAVDGESQAFEQHGSLLQLGISVGEQTQRAALGHSHPG